jgi:hypothetical protein
MEAAVGRSGASAGDQNGGASSVLLGAKEEKNKKENL